MAPAGDRTRKEEMMRSAFKMVPGEPSGGPKPLTEAEIQRETKRMKRARTLLLMRHPFFGYLAAKLRLVSTDQYETLATDGRSLFFNPRFTAMLDDDLTLTAFVHEVLHCACEHFDRQGDREAVRWRKAADHAINPILVKSGFKAILVPGLFEWLCDEQKFGGKTAEAIYQELPPEPPGSGNAGCVLIPATDSGGKGDGDGKEDPQTGGGGKAAVQSAPPPPPPVNWKRAVVEAANFARVRGNLPGHLEEIVNSVVHPRINWRSVIRSQMNKAVKTDWSWRRPNRRYAHQGIVIPTPFGYTTSVEWWGDTSGSVGADFFALGLGAGVEICRQLRIRLDAGVCDTDVRGFWRNVRDTEILEKVRFLGRGGTDFRPIFRHIRDGKRKPDVVVIVTDLCGEFPPPEERPSYQVIWLTLENFKDIEVPFGRKVLVSPKELEGRK